MTTNGKKFAQGHNGTLTRRVGVPAHRSSSAGQTVGEYTHPTHSPSAFTLVEVMLSLFLALILLVGMNAVFRATSDTVRAGQTLSEVTRNSRTVQPILYGDMRDCATDSPAFVITSCVVPQYLNAADAKTTQAYAASQTPPLPNADLPVSGCLLGDHLHRCDMLMFFARGQYHRKTENTPVDESVPPPYPLLQNYQNSPTTSDEAYIHYGHLRMVGSDGISAVGPDDYAGVAEPYASSWVLGRNVTLMMATNPNGTLVANPIVPGSNPKIGESYYSIIGQRGPPQQPPFPTNLFNNTAPGALDITAAPLGFGSPEWRNGATAANPPNPPPGLPSLIQSSRYDMAGASIDQFRSIVTSSAAKQAANQPINNTPYYFWWTSLIYQFPNNLEDTGANAFVGGAVYPNTPLVSQFYGAINPLLDYGPNPAVTAPYDTAIPPLPPTPGPLRVSQTVVKTLAAHVTAVNSRQDNQWFPRFRYRASTLLSTVPMTSQDQANLSPIFLEHVSQFIVEYAGDYLTQDTTGNVTADAPDGQIDWVYATKGYWNPNATYQPGDWVIAPAPAGAPLGGFFYTPNDNQYGFYQAAQAIPADGFPPTGPSAQWNYNTNPANVNQPLVPPKVIRWYGMPRDATGAGQVWSSYHPDGYITSTGALTMNLKSNTPRDTTTVAAFTHCPTANELNNVVPLADLWRLAGNAPLPVAPPAVFNKVLITVPYEVETGPALLDPLQIVNNGIGNVIDYADTSINTPANTVRSPLTGMTPLARYTAVWRNDVPAMIRIIYKVDDPNNDLKDGPTYECVFKLK